MTEEITRLIWTFVALLIAGNIIMMIVGLLDLTALVAKNEQTEVNSTDIMKEYREYSMYNNGHNDETIFYAADIISALMKFKGIPEIEVKYYQGVTLRKVYWCERERVGYVDTTGSREQVSISRPKFNDNVKEATYNIEILTDWFEEKLVYDKPYTSSLVIDDEGTVARIIFIQIP